MNSLPVADRVFGFQVPDVLAIVGALYDRWMQRTNLADLDDRMLRDMGISRADVERELSKPFWRLS
ncbi:MAG: DUF1127 domain-containing protein [Alphaproteobacteria bacterium]|nr:MAG: DUF1127 domain-containing protein [Alphaproteobacteria bacterium]